MVVTGSHVGGERPQCVEGSVVADLLLQDHVLHHLVQGDVSRALDHDLDVVAPGHLGELTQSAELGELGLVVGIGDAPRAQSVAQGEGHVVGGHDLANLGEPGVEEVLGVMGQAPGGHDRTAPAHDAGGASGGQGHVAEQHPGVDGEVVDPLLGLLDEGVAVEVPGQLGRHPVHFLQGLVDGHGADGHRCVAQDPLAGGVDVGAGGEVHDRVGPPAGGPGRASPPPPRWRRSPPSCRCWR